VRGLEREQSAQTLCDGGGRKWGGKAEDGLQLFGKKKTVMQVTSNGKKGKKQRRAHQPEVVGFEVQSGEFAVKSKKNYAMVGEEGAVQRWKPPKRERQLTMKKKKRGSSGLHANSWGSQGKKPVSEILGSRGFLWEKEICSRLLRKGHVAGPGPI